MTPPATTVDEPVPRTLARSVAIGLGIGLGAAAIAFFLIAIPFYTLASFEPNGIDRPIVRTGLFRIALPVGALIGLAVGVGSARWARRGGSWSLGSGDDRYTTR